MFAESAIGQGPTTADTVKEGAMIGVARWLNDVGQRCDGTASRAEKGDLAPFDLDQRVPERLGALGGSVYPGELINEVCATPDRGAYHKMLFEVSHVYTGVRSMLVNFDKHIYGFGEFVGIGCCNAPEQVEEAVVETLQA
jgi:hypothetical protein